MRIPSFLLLFMAESWRQPMNIASAAPLMTDDPILKDPDLVAALELFIGMSPDERKDTIQGLKASVGDDPQRLAEMEELLDKLSALDVEQLENSPGGTHSSIQQMIQDDEVATAKRDARKMLDGTTWEFFWENQEAILESTIASGQLSPEDAALFKTDEGAWKEKLRFIFDDLVGNQEL